MSTFDFPGFDRLFWFSSGSSKHFYANVDFGDNDDVDVLRGVVRPRHSSAIWEMGSAVPDTIIWPTSACSPVLMHQKLVQELQVKGVTGWSAFPVAVLGKNLESIDGYHALVVTGRSGAIDRSRSRSVVRQFPGGTFPRMLGLYFAEESWDGTDIFMPNGATAHVFVTERARQVLSVSRNICFGRLDKYTYRPEQSD